MDPLGKQTVPPIGFRLLDGETLFNIETFSPRHPSGPPSSINELRRLTRTTGSSKTIGDNGPAIAALSYDTANMSANHQGLYSVVFGRDALRVAIDLTDQYPRLAQTTLLSLAELQGTEFVTDREEEPGRIPHEVRTLDDPIAQELSASRGWGWPYYGSVDATPEFIRTLSAFCNLHDDNMAFLSQAYINKDGESRVIADALTAAANWLIARIKENNDGLLEFKSSIPLGIENQVWKDSWDAYHHSDGAIANHKQGIASIEVQTVTHDALIDAAKLYEYLERHDDAIELREHAQALQSTILDKFWTEDKGGYFVLGTDRDDDGNLRQLKIRTSNMGHMLNSHVIDGYSDEIVHKREMTLVQLQSPELLGISGIRTLASDEVRYREGSYHNGSVWIWDTHHIAKGAARHADTNPDFRKFADILEDRILHVVDVIGGFPEYVRGGDIVATNTSIIDVVDPIDGRINRIEQPPQEIQAWTVAAILATKFRRGTLGH